MSTSEALQTKLRHLPDRPGVYLMKDSDGQILYVGKAKSLRPRVRSYFSSSRHDSLKTRELVRRIRDLETIVVNSEAEALILENNLIKEHRPRFNINLRDDKTYPYIKVTVDEAFPRVIVTRKLSKDGARYFGPFTDVRRMRQALTVVKRLYTVRSCHYRLPVEAPDRPCLDYHIGRCKAPCVSLQTESDYRTMISEITDVLGGHTKRAAARIRTEMEQAAEALQFERAGELRDAMRQLAALEARQQVVDVEGSDRDVVAYVRDGEEACGVVLRIREGKLLGREGIFLDNAADETDEAILSSLAGRMYITKGVGGVEGVPPEILFPAEFADLPLLETILSDLAGRRIHARIPQRGDKARLVELAEQNARHLLEERRLLQRGAGGGPASDVLYELQAALALDVVPRRIVCFDVSHTQGSETVASAVVFENGIPHKAGYRRFRIKGQWGNDDFRSMHEAVARYFRRLLDEDAVLPELVVIDGGRGQLNAARAALEPLGLAEVATIGLAKRDEEVYLSDRSEPLRLPRRLPPLRLLQRMRDEAHRFAVSYNRNLRTKRTVRSELSTIPGVGGARQRQLLERFGSVRGIAQSAESDIAALPGFGAALAKTVREHAQRLAGHSATNSAGGTD